MTDIFKKMVYNPNSSNSDKNYDSDCCKECKEYCCVTKEECDWIKCSLCEKWLHENCTIFSKTCIEFGRNNHSKKNLRNLQTSKKEPHNDTERNYFILLRICLLQIYYFLLHYMRGIFHHSYAKYAILIPV
jgi:hypothetical protein